MVFIRNSSLKKGAPLRKEELIHKDDIKETLYPLKESDTDYITMSGEIYKYYYDDLYFKKTPLLDGVVVKIKRLLIFKSLCNKEKLFYGAIKEKR